MLGIVTAARQERDFASAIISYPAIIVFAVGLLVVLHSETGHAPVSIFAIKYVSRTETPPSLRELLVP